MVQAYPLGSEKKSEEFSVQDQQLTYKSRE